MRVNVLPAALLALLFAAAPVHAQGEPEHKAKASVDDRADPHVHADDVGKAGRMGRKDLAPGAYFNDRHREAVRSYYAAHAVKDAAPAEWRIGERLPAAIKTTPVPAPLVAKLPAAPPGLRYVQAGADVLLVATGSQMVVDGINGH